jgi:hypothetical protein
MLKSEVTEMLVYLHADHGVELKPEKVAVWHDALENTPKAEAWRVAKQLSQTCRFVPKLADFVAVVANNTTAQSESWGDAWISIQAAISRFGFYQAQAAIDSMSVMARASIGGVEGFRELCRSEMEQMTTCRAQFRQRWEAYEHRGEVAARAAAVDKKNVFAAPAPLSLVISDVVKKLGAA